MDFSTFYVDHVDAITWLNQQLKDLIEDETVTYTQIESRLRDGIAQLESDAQKWNDENSLILEKLRLASPSVLDGVTSVEKQSSFLRNEMMKVKDNLKVLLSETGSTTESILTMDMMIGRMESSKQALQEAENWNLVKSFIERKLNSRSKSAKGFTEEDEELSTKIQELERCLVILQHIPGFHEKKALLVEYKERFAIYMDMSIVVAAEEKDSDACTRILESLKRIKYRERFFAKFYEVRQREMMKLWEDLLKRVKRTQEDWAVIISSFIDRLLPCLGDERDFYAKIFPLPEKHLLEFIGVVFDGSNKSFIENELNRWASGDPGLFVEQLILTLEHIQKFAKHVCNEYILKIEVADVTWKEDRIWLRHLLSGFVGTIQTYIDFEVRILAEIEKRVLQRTRNINEPLSRLREQLDAVFPELKISLLRCMTVTNGLLLDKWGVMCRETLLYLLDRFKRLVAESKGRLGFEEKSDRLGASQQPIIKPTQQHGIQERPLNSIVSDNQQWVFFENSLRLVEFCSAFDKKFGIVCREINDHLDNIHQRALELKTSRFPPVSSEDGDSIDEIALDSIICIELLSSVEWPTDAKIQEELQAMMRLVHSDIMESTKMTQRLLLDILYQIPKKFMSQLNKTLAWQSDDSKQQKATRTPSLTELPKFSLSPSNPITRIGEYLLMLPQQLEPYSEDDALLFSYSTLPYTETFVEVNEEKIPAVKRWLCSLCTLFTSDYVTHILQIPKLSSEGHRQLLTDIQYIDNILSALDIQRDSNTTFMLLHSVLIMSREERDTLLGSSTMDIDKRKMIIRLNEMLSNL